MMVDHLMIMMMRMTMIKICVLFAQLFTRYHLYIVLEALFCTSQNRDQSSSSFMDITWEIRCPLTSISASSQGAQPEPEGMVYKHPQLLRFCWFASRCCPAWFFWGWGSSHAQNSEWYLFLCYTILLFLNKYYNMVIYSQLRWICWMATVGGVLRFEPI